jgi:hypothetical protein
VFDLATDVVADPDVNQDADKDRNGIDIDAAIPFSFFGGGCFFENPT